MYNVESNYESNRSSSLSEVWIACSCCGDCGAVAVLELTGQPVWLLSELISAFSVDGKGGRSRALTRFGANLAFISARWRKLQFVGSSLSLLLRLVF